MKAILKIIYRKRLREVKKAISIWAHHHNMTILTSTQDIWIRGRFIIVKSHKVGAWYGRGGETIREIAAYVNTACERTYIIKIKGGDLWKY
jgi:hypothetical protein